MKILTGGGWIKVFLEEISIGMEKDTDIRDVRMTLSFSTDSDKRNAEMALPFWTVEMDKGKIEMFNGEPLNVGENMLAN